MCLEAELNSNLYKMFCQLDSLTTFVISGIEHIKCLNDALEGRQIHLHKRKAQPQEQNIVSIRLVLDKRFEDELPHSEISHCLHFTSL